MCVNFNCIFFRKSMQLDFNKNNKNSFYFFLYISKFQYQKVYSFGIKIFLDKYADRPGKRGLLLFGQVSKKVFDCRIIVTVVIRVFDSAYAIGFEIGTVPTIYGTVDSFCHFMRSFTLQNSGKV